MINVMCIFIFVNWDTLVPWAYQLCCLPSINNTIQYTISALSISSPGSPLSGTYAYIPMHSSIVSVIAMVSYSLSYPA